MLFSDLNDNQRHAVMIPGGPVLVLAGAGSGKTRTLTYRLAHLLLQGVPAERIVALTFTNKAAGEMKDRVEQLAKKFSVKDQRSKIGSLPFVGTFHSFGVKLLRELGPQLGFSPRFLIYDEDDVMRLIKEIMKEQDVSLNPEFVCELISMGKTNLQSPEDFSDSHSPVEQQVAEIWAVYDKRLRKAEAFDFDDLLVQPLKIFERHPAILLRLQQRYQHMLVDEYQDTNTPQYLLVKQLAGRHRNLFVVGDDYQSIYSFRQADYRNILNFEHDWPDASVVYLEENYRSTKTILQAANQLIRANKFQKHKTLWTTNEEGEFIEVNETLDETAEATLVAEKIFELQDHYALSDIAVLYRANFQSRALEEFFLIKRIPYKIFGGTHFYQRKEIKDIMAYAKVLHNPNDLVSLKRIINVPPRGIGMAAQERLFHVGEEAIWQKIAFSQESKSKYQNEKGKFKREENNLDSATLKFFDLIRELKKELFSASRLSAFLRLLVEKIKYDQYLKPETEEGLSRLENVYELISVAQKFDVIALRSLNKEKSPIEKALEEFLTQAALFEHTDNLHNEATIKLMTLHLAKGLEFPVVFIVGLEEKLLPHWKNNQGMELEEERRLMYVGLTRAKKKVFLSFARNRRLWGSLQAMKPSRFLQELPEETMKMESVMQESDDSEPEIMLAEHE